MLSRIIVLILIFLTNLNCMAFAEPVVVLKEWQAALAIEEKLYALASARVENRVSGLPDEDSEVLGAKVKEIIAGEKNPYVISRVAHMALLLGGEAGDGPVDDVLVQAYFVSIAQFRRIGTAESLDVLEDFKQMERLDGGYSWLVNETIADLEIIVKRK